MTHSLPLIAEYSPSGHVKHPEAPAHTTARSGNSQRGSESSACVGMLLLVEPGQSIMAMSMRSRPSLNRCRMSSEQIGSATERLACTRGASPAMIEYDPAGHMVQLDDPAVSPRGGGHRCISKTNREARPDNSYIERSTAA